MNGGGDDDAVFVVDDDNEDADAAADDGCAAHDHSAIQKNTNDKRVFSMVIPWKPPKPILIVQAPKLHLLDRLELAGPQSFEARRLLALVSIRL